MSTDHYYEIAVTTLPGIGSQSARQLLTMVESAEALFSMSRADLKQIFGSHNEIIRAITERSTLGVVDQEMEFVRKNNIKVLYYRDADFPQRLNLPDCIDAPIVLYSLGAADYNMARSVSVVGTRRATPEGTDLTHKLVGGFKGEGITVVSGLALGIDAAAHTAALNNHLPTIAVLAHGLNMLYPPQNRQLAKQILQSGGALVTETRSSTPLHPRMFPARNRIIAGLGDATVVVEASSKGGALITANIATGYHRDLFAFPGRIGDKYSEGCNAIIASAKAMLIRGADDLFVDMGWQRTAQPAGTQTTIFPELSADEELLYKTLEAHPGVSIDQIQELVDLPTPKIAAALLNLELKNICRCLPGKIYKLI